jgi:hypothetical protein
VSALRNRYRISIEPFTLPICIRTIMHESALNIYYFCDLRKRWEQCGKLTYDRQEHTWNNTTINNKRKDKNWELRNEAKNSSTDRERLSTRRCAISCTGVHPLAQYCTVTFYSRRGGWRRFLLRRSSRIWINNTELFPWKHDGNGQ